MTKAEKMNWFAWTPNTENTNPIDSKDVVLHKLYNICSGGKELEGCEAVKLNKTSTVFVTMGNRRITVPHGCYVKRDTKTIWLSGYGYNR